MSIEDICQATLAVTRFAGVTMRLRGTPVIGIYSPAKLFRGQTAKLASALRSFITAVPVTFRPVHGTIINSLIALLILIRR